MFDRIWIGNIISFIASNDWLAIYNRANNCCSGSYVACLLEKGGDTYMTIVVKKVPKFLRGFVKLIFRIKD